MAASILVKDLFYRVSAQLSDLSPQFTRWTHTDLVDYYNDGARAIAKLMPSATMRMDSIKLDPGVRQSLDSVGPTRIIPGDGSTPTTLQCNQLVDVVCLMGEDGQTPGDAMRLFDRNAMDLMYPQWGSKTGTPREYAVDERMPKTFWVYPGVASDETWWVRCMLLADPVALPYDGDYSASGSDTTVLSIDDVNLDDLFNYMMARAHMRDAEYAAGAALAQVYVTAFVNSMNQRVKAMTGTSPNLQTLPNAPSQPAP